MAKSWDNMSKEEREASGQTKKEYNRSTGQSTIPKYNSEPTPTPTATPTPTPTTSTKDGEVEAPSWYKNSDSSTPSTMQKGLTKEQWESKNAPIQQKKESEAAKVQAKEKASAYLKSGGSRDAEYDAILKEGGLNNHTYQQMTRADQKAAYEQTQIDRDKEREAYNQSRLDLQAHKAQFGPKNVYGRQSARDTHERSMARGNPKVTGPAGNEDPYLISQNEIAQQLYDSGYDYSHQEMARHANGGSDKSAMNSYLYDEYGGYDNWYNNHSLYSGNFTGSKDLMDFDKVMEIGQQQQDALKNYQTSDEYMSKYGQYDWAKDFNEKYGQGAN